MSPILLSLAIRLPSVANLREHWAKKAKRAQRQREIIRLIAEARLEAFAHPAWSDVKRLKIILTRIAPRTLDTDNLASAFKAIRDGIADALGLDDGDERLTWLYEQRKGDYALEICILSRT